MHVSSYVSFSIASNKFSLSSQKLIFSLLFKIRLASYRYSVSSLRLSSKDAFLDLMGMVGNLVTTLLSNLFQKSQNCRAQGDFDLMGKFAGMFCFCFSIIFQCYITVKLVIGANNKCKISHLTNQKSNEQENEQHYQIHSFLQFSHQQFFLYESNIFTQFKIVISFQIFLHYFIYQNSDEYVSRFLKLLSLIIYKMSQKNQTALQKMQQIANRLISNTPELAKMLDNDSALKPKKPTSPSAKKGKPAIAATMGSSSKNQMTANDYHQRCKDLTSQVQYWREKCVTLQEEIAIIKQRFVQREIQYRGIIEQLQEEIKSKSCLDSSDRNRMQQINELHKQIIDNIASIQNKTSKILIEQQSDIRRFFNKKINEIKDKFKEDRINKNQKDQEYQQKEKQMASELEWIKNIAHKIDEENKTLMKKYSYLKAEFQIQEKDKDLLLKELLMKKKENAALRTQVEQYEKLLNQVSREMQESQIKPEDLSIIEKAELQPQQQNTNSKIANSKVKTQKSEFGDTKRYQNTVSHLNKVIAKQKAKIRELKNLYMKEMGNKSELQKIVRRLVQDTREAIIGAEKEKTAFKRRNEEMSVQAREKLLERLLSNEKILTLIYDKTFYSGNRQIQDMEIPSELKKILEDNEVQGFD